ncbi:MAG: MATE family efflux transporter [Ruminococcus sp.]|nr:MATE family efflux transporter [Ruminococcus sp.]
MSKTSDMTEGKVSRLILAFFFPMLATNMLQQIYSIADTAIVGKGLGDNALASVGNMSSLSFLIIGFSLGLSTGFSVLIGQSFGAKDYDKMRRTTAASIKLAAIITVFLTAVSVIFLKPVLEMLRTDSSIMKDSLTYGYIIFGGLFASISYNMCSGILRALGDSRTPLTAIIISTVINIVLDWFFIFIMKTGVEGAAIATVLAQVISTVVCFAKLRKLDILRLSRKDFAPDLSLSTSLLKNGLPMALMNSITAVGCMVIQYFVNGLGVAYTSAFSACSRFINMFIQPACTAGFTMSAFTSQNYGAEKYTRIREGLKVCLTIAFIAYLIFGSIMTFFPRQISAIMLNGDEPISLAAQYMPICGIMMFLVDFLFVFRSGVQGMGYPFIPMCSGILEMIMRIGVIVLFINRIGFTATAWADCAAWAAALALNIIGFVVVLHKKISSVKPKKAVKNKTCHVH